MKGRSRERACERTSEHRGARSWGRRAQRARERTDETQHFRQRGGVVTRLLLVLIVIAFFVLCAAAMRWGWRNRQRRQAYLPDFPQAPADLTFRELPELSGVYVGTVTAGDWQDRIAGGDIGHRSAGTVPLGGGGPPVDPARAR